MTSDDILASLQRRYATKLFDSHKKVDSKHIATLKEVLRLTPSSFGIQPWKFMIIQDPILKQDLQKHAFDQTQITSCSHLIVLCGVHDIDDHTIDVFTQQTIAQGGDPERANNYNQSLKKNMAKHRTHGTMSLYVSNQVYIALGSLLQACAHLRIDACPMGGFDAAAYEKILGLDTQSIHPIVLCPIGYRSAEDSYLTKPKFRYSQDDIFVG